MDARQENEHIFYIKNILDFLSTVALRFPLMYGEEDRQCFSKLIAVSEKWNGQIPKIAGDGGKHQLIYAGKKVDKAKKNSH